MKSSSEAITTIRNFILIASALAISYIFFHLAIYTHPSEADDYCFGYQFRLFGTWEALVRNYLLWSGGYTSTLISGVIAAKSNFVDIYKFIPMVLLLATISAASIFFGSIFKIKLSNPWLWLGGLGYSLLFISIMPAVVSGFYWFNGAVTYQLANICLMLIFAQCLRIIDLNAEQKPNISAFISLAIFIVIGIGCTETVMVEIVAFVSCICIWRLIVDKHNRPAWSFIFIITVTFFLIYVLAPGNFQRATHIAVKETVNHAGYDVINAYKSSVYFGILELNNIFYSIQLWCATFLYVILFRAFGGSRFYLKDKIRTSHILFNTLVCLLLPLLLQFPSQLIISNIPAERTQNAIYFGFLLSWFSLWSLLTIKFFQLPRLNNLYQEFRGVTSLITSALLIFFIGVSPNIMTAYSDLTNKAELYDAALNKRYTDIIAAVQRGETNITISLLDNPPATINVVSQTISVRKINHSSCFSTYFGMRSLNHQ